MRTPQNPYSDMERAKIEANSIRAHEKLQAQGITLPLSTHRELAEFALILAQIKQLEKNLAAITGEDKT